VFAQSGLPLTSRSTAKPAVATTTPADVGALREWIVDGGIGTATSTDAATDSAWTGEDARGRSIAAHRVRESETTMLDWLKRLTGSKALTAAPSAPLLESGFSPRSRRIDSAREVGDGLDSSVVMAPILWIARTFTESPLSVYRRGPAALAS